MTFDAAVLARDEFSEFSLWLAELDASLPAEQSALLAKRRADEIAMKRSETARAERRVKKAAASVSV
jgi:hypothetical protein